MAQEPEDEKNEDVPDETSGYKIPPKQSVDKLMEKDKDDEALQKYKAQLLGDQKAKIIDENDDRLIFFDALVVKPVGRDEIKLDPSKLKKDAIAFTLKEKSAFSVEIQFRVQKEIVTGLKKFQSVYKKGIRVEKATEMMGSYAPNNKKTYNHSFPEETTPGGMLARGGYTAKTQFIDDDKKVHLAFEYGFKIAKDWE